MRNSNASQDKTIESYNNFYETYKSKTPKVVTGLYAKWIDKYISFLPSSAKVFEIGSAVGRDAKYLNSKGVFVTCSDVIDQALIDLSLDGFETLHYNFRDGIPLKLYGKYDGVFANAVLLHASKDEITKVLLELSKALKPNGIIGMSFKENGIDGITQHKLGGDRMFYFYDKKLLESKLPDNLKIIDVNYINNKRGVFMQIITQKKF